MGFMNKTIVAICAVCALITLIITSVAAWKREVKRDALLEWNKTQLETVLNEQKKYDAAMKDVAENQAALLEAMTLKNQELQTSLGDLQVYLDSKETAKADRPSSPILKETVKQLSGAKPR